MRAFGAPPERDSESGIFTAVVNDGDVPSSLGGLVASGEESALFTAGMLALAAVPTTWSKLIDGEASTLVAPCKVLKLERPFDD